MKFECVFKHVKKTDHLVEYAKSKLDKLQKFELKPFQTQIIFSEDSSRKTVELIIVTRERKYVAKATDENCYKAFDAALQKVSRQAQKTKSKVQHHRHSELSGGHQLSCLNEQLEMDYSKITGAPRQKAA